MSTLKALRNPAVKNLVELCATQYCIIMSPGNTLFHVTLRTMALRLFCSQHTFRFWNLGQHTWNWQYGQCAWVGLVFTKVSPWGQNLYGSLGAPQSLAGGWLDLGSAFLYIPKTYSRKVFIEMPCYHTSWPHSSKTLSSKFSPPGIITTVWCAAEAKGNFSHPEKSLVAHL